jgi:hypothetical protein
MSGLPASLSTPPTFISHHGPHHAAVPRFPESASCVALSRAPESWATRVPALGFADLGLAFLCGRYALRIWTWRAKHLWFLFII